MTFKKKRRRKRKKKEGKRRTETDSEDCFAALKGVDLTMVSLHGSVLPVISGMKNVLLSLD